MNKDRDKILKLLYIRYYSETRVEEYEQLSLKTGVDNTKLRQLLEELASQGMIKTGVAFSDRDQTSKIEWAKITKAGRDFCRAKGLGVGG